MKATIFTIAISLLVINFAPECVAQVNGALTGTMSSYDSALNQQIQLSDQSVSDQLQHYNAYTTQLKTELDNVAGYAQKCSPALKGRFQKAVTTANQMLGHDLETMNTQLGALVSSVQASTVDRGLASTGGVTCEATIQAGVAGAQVLAASISSTSVALRAQVGADLTTAQKNLPSDGLMRTVFAPSDDCPEQAYETYKQAKDDFKNLTASYNGVQSSLTNTAQLVQTKGTTLASQRAVCSSVASQ